MVRDLLLEGGASEYNGPLSNVGCRKFLPRPSDLGILEVGVGPQHR